MTLSTEDILKNFNGYFIYVAVTVESFLFMVINVCRYIAKIFLACGKVTLLIVIYIHVIRIVWINIKQMIVNSLARVPPESHGKLVPYEQ